MRIARLLERLGNGLAARDEPSGPDAHDVERVSAVLMIEVARADGHVDEAELAAVRRAIGRSSTLPAAEIDALVEEAVADADATTTLHRHLSLLNERLSKADKARLVEQLWRVAEADGEIDKYEEGTIRRLADLLHLGHSDYIRAKLRVLDPDALEG